MLTHTIITRPYADKKVRPVAYDYRATASAVAPADGVPYLELTATGGRRFVDAINLSRKLDKDGNGKDVTVTFAEAAERVNVTSGEKLSALFGKVRKWFASLAAVAFSGKAADLETDATHRLVTDAEKTAWSDKTPSAHTHTIANVTNLQNTLDGKVDNVGRLKIWKGEEFTAAMKNGIACHITDGEYAFVTKGRYAFVTTPEGGKLNENNIWHSGNLDPNNIKANGGNATSAGDGSMIIYPQSSNELNFSGTHFSGTVYFGYRGIGDTPKPTLYVFGDTVTGSAEVRAAKFVQAGQQVATVNNTMQVICAGEVTNLGQTALFKGYFVSSRTSVGVFNIIHNYGSTGYIVQATGIDGEVAAISSKASNNFIVRMKSDSSTRPADGGFSFVMYKI